MKKQDQKETAAVNKESAQSWRGPTRTVRGVVVSDKMTKTIVVAVTRMVRHPVYAKFVRSTKKFVAHDEKEECGIGDTVMIMETRPLSRTKRWRLKEVVRKAQV